MLAALAVSAIPLTASLSGTASAAARADAEIAQILQAFERLSRPSQEMFLAYLRWEVEDGRPETDPRRDDPAWAEFNRRRTIGA
ncbi:MAG: hypothetical protein DI537_36090 [Stutzerimonas stutzeri]|nr:MAG: hypothetical protein DI537_36090 [Stutzerimonas stutzeri]